MSSDSLRDRRARDLPPPHGQDRRQDPLIGVAFDTEDARQIALGVPLRPENFWGWVPSGASGYTADDVRRLAALGA